MVAFNAIIVCIPILLGLPKCSFWYHKFAEMPSHSHRYNTRRSYNGRSPSQASSISSQHSNNRQRPDTPQSSNSSWNSNNIPQGIRTPRQNPDTPLSSNSSQSSNSTPQGINTPRRPDTPQSSNSAPQGTNKPQHPNIRYKGARIWFVSGIHYGKYEWIDKAKGDGGLAGTTRWHVLIQENDGREVFPARPIWRSSWEYYDWAVKSKLLDENLFQEHQSIWSKIKELNDHLKAFGGLPSDTEEEAMDEYREFADFFSHHFMYRAN